MIQKERNQVLDATEETIRSLADYIESMMGAGTVCAIGNDRKLEEENKMRTLKSIMVLGLALSTFTATEAAKLTFKVTNPNEKAASSLMAIRRTIIPTSWKNIAR